MSTIYKGGYLTIDVGGGDVTVDGGVIVPGVSTAIKDAKGKNIYFKNVKFGNDLYALVIPAAIAYSDASCDLYVYAGAGITVTITYADDSITATIIA